MNNTHIPPISQRVLHILDAHGLPYTLLAFPESTHTAQQAAEAIGCDRAQIVKSLLFKTKQTHQPIFIMVSGINRVNEKTIEAHIHEEIMKADADFTQTITGFTIGGIPPCGHQQPSSFVFMDKDLLSFDTVWAAGGTANTVFSLSPIDLLAITHAEVIAVV